MGGSPGCIVVAAREDVRLAVCGGAEVIHYGYGGGHIFSPDEIYEEIVKFY